jgi:hypothetical protein
LPPDTFARKKFAPRYNYLEDICPEEICPEDICPQIHLPGRLLPRRHFPQIQILTFRVILFTFETIQSVKIVPISISTETLMNSYWFKSNTEVPFKNNVFNVT